MPTKTAEPDEIEAEKAEPKKKAPAKKAAPKKAVPKKAAAKKTAAKKAAPKKAAGKTKAAPKTEYAETTGEDSVDMTGKSLVIVESPTKAKTIEKYLGSGFSVIASFGHIRDLPASSLGVDIENNFTPIYEVSERKQSVVDTMRKRARGATRIYLAPDPDREGEAIAFHIASVLDNGRGKRDVVRAVFNEITRDAIREAIANPIEINQNLVNAQQARRILDRLVGYKISPLLWKKVKMGLSAGRVQSVTLRIIVDREREVRAFIPVEYWTIEADAEAKNPPPFLIKLDKINGAKAEVPNKEAADKIISEVTGKPFVVGEVIKKDSLRRPLPPFITSTMQQEASRKLRMTAARTMMMAQSLYEGVELGAEGRQGLITYMRTDSTRLAPSALDMIRGFINQKWGADYLPENARFYAKGKGAQDAHEAIRPTDISLTPERVAQYLEKPQLALYTMIWNRTVACQMADAKMENTRVEVPVGQYLFSATGSVVKFPGHLAVYEEARDEIGKTESDEEKGKNAEPVDDNTRRLPALEKGDKLKVDKVDGIQHFTQPPPRFTEAGLIKELEKQGIGRPSTYASIISTIQGKEYTIKDGGVFKPTDLGFIICDMLVESFPQIMDVKFTAMMEGQLDEVEEGKVNWVQLLQNFYGPFSKKLEEAGSNMRNLRAETVATDHKCEKCGSPMVVRWGRNGKFLACSAYPNCKSTKPITVAEDGTVEIQKEEISDKVCPNCGKAMVVKSGRRGRFLACSGYPDCKTSQPLPIGVPCPRPGCTGELYERRSAKGRTFYSCSAYPECTFSVWELPVKATCEVCAEEKFFIGKDSKRKVFGCSRPDCVCGPVYTGEEKKPRGKGKGKEEEPEE